MYNQGKIMRRLLGRPTNDSTANDNNLGPTGSPITPSYRPSASQDAEYPAGGPIACLDKSPDGHFAVLGGRHTLKTIHIDGSSITEGIDVRAIITSQPNTKPGISTTVSDQLSIKDVKWANNHGGEPTIFTACANGRIFQYNLARLGSQTAGGTGLEFVQMREDSRQINALDINPHKNSWLLSGSQDGIVRCFDTKAPASNRNGQATYRAFQSFKCNAEGIRDVEWSPKDGFVFACASESGAVLKWDIRKTNAPLLRINAHDPTRGVTCIAWHNDGNALLSAGLDSACHVWDMSTDANKRQKPKWTISTPAPVSCVAWRPGLWSATAKGRRAAQIAVSYVDGPARGHGISPVHIWDFGRPTMPFKEIDRFEHSPNALLWHDQDLLWTAGLDGFIQCDVAYAPKVVDRKPSSGFAFTPSGDVFMVLEERLQPRRPHPQIATHDMLPTASFSSSPNAQVLSHSRSDSEEDVVGSFLGPSKSGKRRQNVSSRLATTISTTPPSGSTTEEPIIPLEQSIGITKPFKPNQMVAIGPMPSPSKSKHYQFLSRHYLDAILFELPSVKDGNTLDVRVCNILEHWARANESIGQIRVAQTWRIITQAFKPLLQRRAKYHLQLRMAKRKNAKSPLLKTRSESKLNIAMLGKTSAARAVSGEETPRKTAPIHSLESRQNLGQPLVTGESGSESNVPTPIARPIREDVTEQHQFIPGKVLTPVKELDSFTLPPAFYKETGRPVLRQRHDSAPLSVISQDSQVSSTEGYDFYDVEAVEAIPQAIDMPKKKDPLSLGYSGPSIPNRQNDQFIRHNSDESLGQMFSVSEGSRLTADASSLSSSLHRVISRSEEMMSSHQSSAEEYESRIRGKQIREFPEASRPSGSRTLDRQGSEIFMISQTTVNSDESQQSPSDFRTLQQQLPIQSPTQLRVNQPQSPRKTSNERLASWRPEENGSITITETDFMPWEDDPPYPFPFSPEETSKLRALSLQPYELLSKVLAHEAQKSAINASAIILLLKPLVPDGIINPDQASAILRHHHDRLMKQKFFTEAATLRNLCVADWPDGIEVWGDNYTSIFYPAQDPQRVSASFTCPNCRKPRDINRSGGGLGIWKCEKCRYTMGACAVCKHRDATVVSHPPTPLIEGITHSQGLRDKVVLSTWWYCPGCKHGGHAACLEGWHAPVPTEGTGDGMVADSFSEGCCPMDGCGHPCLPGKWREELNAAKKEPLERKVREHTRSTIPSLNRNDNKMDLADPHIASAPAVIGGVKSDAFVASQSRAVDGARAALAASGPTSGALPEDNSRLSRAAGGILSVLSSSPGRSSTQGLGAVDSHGMRSSDKGERERRKSVKFAANATDERR